MANKSKMNKDKVLKRDNYICQYCGNRATTVDHIIPKYRGGTIAQDNLVASCRPCNVAKSNYPIEFEDMKKLMQKYYKYNLIGRARVVAEFMGDKKKVEDIRTGNFYRTQKRKNR